MWFEKAGLRLPRRSDLEFLLLCPKQLHQPAILSVLGEFCRLFAASSQMCITVLPLLALELYFLWLCSCNQRTISISTKIRNCCHNYLPGVNRIFYSNANLSLLILVANVTSSRDTKYDTRLNQI